MPVETKQSSPVNYLLAAGPDKLALGGFVQWSRRRLACPIGDMHSLMSVEACDTYVQEFCRLNARGILSYYARRKVNILDPMVIIPASLKNAADIIIWFELYDPNPKILKSPEGDMISKMFIEDWKKFLNVQGA